MKTLIQFVAVALIAAVAGVLVAKAQDPPPGSARKTTISVHGRKAGSRKWCPCRRAWHQWQRRSDLPADRTSAVLHRQATRPRALYAATGLSANMIG
jgi:hypothetical protein